MSDKIEREGSIGSVAAGNDMCPVTLDDDNDFKGLGAGLMARGFYATTDGTVAVVTASGNTRLIPVVAHKDILCKIKRFKSTGSTGGIVVWAF